MTPAEETQLLAGELRRLLTQLQHLLPQQVTDPTQGTTTRHQVTGSPAPWHPEAGPLLMTIHAGVRELEENLRYLVTGHTGQPRGGSDANTLAALDAITTLIHGVPETAATRVRNQLAAWVQQAREIRDIGEAEKWVPIHVPRGELPPECPYCGTYSLRVAQETGRVRCFNQECRDSDGRRPSGWIDRNRVTGEAVLVWADGRTTYGVAT